MYSYSMNNQTASYRSNLETSTSTNSYKTTQYRQLRQANVPHKIVRGAPSCQIGSSKPNLQPYCDPSINYGAALECDSLVSTKNRNVFRPANGALRYAAPSKRVDKAFSGTSQPGDDSDDVTKGWEYRVLALAAMASIGPLVCCLNNICVVCCNYLYVCTHKVASSL